MTTYFVTGGTGFIGSALVKRLLAGGHAVRAFDNDLRGKASRLNDCAGSLELIIGDVRDEKAVAAAARGCDAIVHLAALNGTENFYQRPDVVLDVGIRGMYAVLDAARAHGIPDFILASSSEVYQVPDEVPTAEDQQMKIPDPWNPRYSYGGSKLIAEIMLANYHRDVIKRAVIFRPHNVYGPDMGFEHVIPQLALRAADLARSVPEGVLPLAIQGDGSDTRSFVYIDDFIDGLMRVIMNGTHRNVYHIGTMDEVPIRTVAEEVVRALGRESRIVVGPRPQGSTPRRCPDIRKLAQLGYRPVVSLREGIARTAPWYAAYADANGTQGTGAYETAARIA